MAEYPDQLSLATTQTSRSSGAPRREEAALLSARQAEVLAYKRRGKSLHEIADHLKLRYSTVHEHYTAALHKVQVEMPAEVHNKLQLPPSWDYVMADELEHMAGAVQAYWDIYNRCLQAGQMRSAIEALNGLRQWVEMRARITGLGQANKSEMTITIDQIDREIDALEGKLGDDGSYSIDDRPTETAEG